MELLNPPVKCVDHCFFILKLIEACPTNEFGASGSFAEEFWQIYMIAVTCIPHGLIVILGLHWLYSKLTYVPFGLVASISTVC